jgi:hypothetical protein
MKVGRDLRRAKTNRIFRKIIVYSDDDRLAVSSVESRARIAPIEAPDRLYGEVGMKAVAGLSDMQVKELLRHMGRPGLVIVASTLVDAGDAEGFTGQRREGLGHFHRGDHEGLQPGPGGR